MAIPAAFTIHQALIKATPIVDKSQQWYSPPIAVEMLASDEREDLDGEIIKATLNPHCLRYLESRGGYNWDHGKDRIGDVEKACFITPDESEAIFGQKCIGAGVYTKGVVYGIPQSALEIVPPDLRKAHYYILAGARLGGSIQGNRKLGSEPQYVKSSDGRNVPVSVPEFIPYVAITPHPINDGTLCRIVKSLGDLFT